MDRPDYVYCILRADLRHKHETWCERPPEGFGFVNIDHAAENGKQQGRLVACPQCVDAITKALRNGG